MTDLTSITLYDLMSQDLEVCLIKNKDKRGVYELHLEDEECEEVLSFMHLEQAALDSMIDFCLEFLRATHRCNKR